MSSMVSWADYAGGTGGPFAGATNEDIMNLNKALMTGSGTATFNSAVPGDGSALRVESLESTLKNTTFSMKEIVLWKNIPKLPARSVLEQYNELQSYGQQIDNGWIAEGDAPNPDDSTYIRRSAEVKYMGTQRAVSYQATLVQNANGDAIANETVAGTMQLLRMVEHGLLYGNSDLSPLQWDGYVTQILKRSPASNIIDLRGAPLDQDVLQDGAGTMSDVPNYGSPDTLVLPPKARIDLVKSFFPNGRYDLFAPPADGMIGGNINGYAVGNNKIRLLDCPFINDGGLAYGPTGGTAAPTAPTVSTQVTTPADSVNSKFAASDVGSYFICVQACNRFGKSAPVYLASGAATAIAAGQKFTFGLTPATGSPPVEWYEVYRGTNSAAIGGERLVLRVPNLNPNTQLAYTTENVINEYNVVIPGTTIGILFQMDKETVSIKQLCPMVKIPLAITKTQIPWMQLLFLVPILYTPQKIILYRNIGRTPNFVGAPV